MGKFVRKVLRISVVLLLTTQSVFCLGDQFELSQTLSEITACLEQKGTLDTSLVSRIEFLNAVTNEVNQSQIIEYTSDWVSKYGDAFPESILLHCLAGGQMDIVQKEYDNFNNLVSKHYARWCLMLRDKPISNQITSQEGTYYKSTFSRVNVRRIDDRNALSGGVYIKRKSWFERRPIVLHDVEAIVSRSGGVPVPWGLYPRPEIKYIPVEVPLDLVRSEASSRVPWRSNSIFGTGTTEPVYMFCEISDNDNQSGHQSFKSVWDYFLETLPPLIYIAGQPVSVVKTNSPLSGEVRYLTRILMSKEKETEAFYNDPDLEQDVLISPPIRYRVEFSGEHPEIKWNEQDLEVK